MTRTLIVPAAGRGSRLGGETPKLMVCVNGRPMVDYILDRYREMVETVLLVVHPDSESLVRDHLKGRRDHVELLFQDQPTGMLDAILIPRSRVDQLNSDEIWITWCDQVAVGEGTVCRLAQAMVTAPGPALAFPTVVSAAPYIHFARDEEGRIARVLQRREGDAMPEEGEGDIGLFALTGWAYLEALPGYAGDATADTGTGTGERNFLPFIPWLARRALVRTIPATRPIEAIGINTREDLALVGRYLAGGQT